MCTCSDIWQKVNSPYGSVWKKKKGISMAHWRPQRRTPVTQSSCNGCVRVGCFSPNLLMPLPEQCKHF